MRFDIENQLSVVQAFSGASTVSENSYKKQTAAQDISIGRRMALLVMSSGVDAAAGTHVLELIQAGVADLTTGLEVLSTISVDAAELALGKEVELPIPQGVLDKQFIGFRHSGGFAATLDVYLVPQDEIAKYKSFPKINHAVV